ncbi:MAG: HopJ type III effector protein [Methylococcaceae bacterium]
MTLHDFLNQLTTNPQSISFNDTMAIIAENYQYQPSEFTNGDLTSAAGINEGSCKIFAFAKSQQLNETQTLQLFGDYYRVDVLNEPNGTGHQNIRNFMQTGWAGIQFNGVALIAN